MKIDATIMGGDSELDIESKIIDCCSLDYNEYLNDRRILTREIFGKKLDQIMKIIEDYALYDFYAAYQVLGRFILLIGIKIPEKTKKSIIRAADWSIEKDLWVTKELEEERRFRLRDLKKKIEAYRGVCNPLDEDLVFYPELVKFYKSNG